MYIKEYISTWQADKSLLTTRLSGDVDETDIDQWQQGFETALAEIPAGASFKMLVNIYGFKAVNFDAHKKFRVILPATLARFDLRIGYLDLFDDAVVTLQSEGGRRCVAIAHTHHDATKMELYQAKCSRSNDKYFANPEAAEAWISSFPIISKKAFDAS